MTKANYGGEAMKTNTHMYVLGDRNSISKYLVTKKVLNSIKQYLTSIFINMQNNTGVILLK